MEEESALSKGKTKRVGRGERRVRKQRDQTKKVGDLDVSYIMFYDNLDDTSIHEIDYYAGRRSGFLFIVGGSISRG